MHSVQHGKVAGGGGGGVDFDNFMSFHSEECLINHQDSAGAMEAKGIVECLGSSLDKYNLRYTEYLGDGDTKSYYDIVNSKPYDDIPVKKLECISDIQKRVGARLLIMRKTKTMMKIAIQRNGKRRNHYVQNYYGIGIRISTGDTVWNLKKAIASAFYHCREATSLEKRRQFCPKTVSSWCK